MVKGQKLVNMDFDFSKIHNQFALIFKNRVADYKNVRNSNKISRVEYLVLFIHLVVGTEIITAESKLVGNKEFKVLTKWDTKYICEYLKESVNATSLCRQEYVFLEKMIDIKESTNYLDAYKKIYDETNVSNCMLAPLFQKLFEESKDIEIVKD